MNTLFYKDELYESIAFRLKNDVTQPGMREKMSIMSDQLLIPPEFYFQATIEIPHCESFAQSIEKGKHPEISTALPTLQVYRDGEQPQIDKKLAWNEDGICLQVSVAGRKSPVTSGTLKAPAVGSRISLGIDTRDVKTNHRLGRFCQMFVLFPPCKKSRTKVPAKAFVVPSQRSPSDGFGNDTEELSCVGTLNEDGYQISCWIPKEHLPGYAPEQVGSLGCYLRIIDDEYGIETLGIGQEFPVESDPSLWISLKLGSAVS